jgi:hypothetical protein
MASLALRHKKKQLLLMITLIVFSAFAADIVDLREDLHILPAPYGCLDNTIMTGITESFDLKPVPVVMSSAFFPRSSVDISFLFLLPCGFRAPPFWS